MSPRQFVFGVSTVLALVGIWGIAQAQNSFTLRIGGGSPGSSVQAGAAGLSILLNKESRDPKLMTTALGTDGATANVRLVESGEAQLGVTAATSMYSSLKGGGAFKGEKPYKNWMAVVPQGFVPLYGVAKKETGIAKLSDIQGKSIALGPAGSGTGATWHQLLPVLGLTGNFRHMPFREGNQRLRDGLVSAHLMGVSRLSAALEAESYLGDDAVWFGISNPKYQKLAKERFPALSVVTMPAGTYHTQTKPFSTIGYSLWIIARKDAPKKAIYEATKLIVEKGKGNLPGYGAWGQVWDMKLIPSFDVLKAIGAKLHPGAAAYFKDHGYKIPAAIQ